MTRGAKIVIFSVVGLFVLAGIYYGFLAPSQQTDTVADSGPVVSETSSLTLTPALTPTINPTLTPANPLASGGYPSTTAGGNFPSALPSDLSMTGPAFAPSSANTAGTTGFGPVAAGNPASTVGGPTIAASTIPTSGQPAVVAPVATTPVIVKTVAKPPVAKAPTRLTAYTITAGDTLGGISGEWFRDINRWKEIVAVNPGLNPSSLQVGQTIQLPSRVGSAAEKMAWKTPAQTASTKVALARSTPTAGSEHVVASGETLASIADGAYGNKASWKTIYEANKTTIGNNPSALKVGMKLTIPAKQS